MTGDAIREAWIELDAVLGVLARPLPFAAAEPAAREAAAEAQVLARDLRKACEEREAELGGLLAKAAWYLRHNYVSGRDVETEASNTGREILAALGVESVPDPGARHG